MRLVSALLSFMLFAFCCFGFLAAFEPGVGLAWKAGYATLALLFFGVGVGVLRAPRYTAPVRARR